MGQSARFLAVLGSLLLLSVQAAPLHTRNEKTDTVSVIDKATGEKVSLKDERVTYLRNGKAVWQASSTPAKRLSFKDAWLTPQGLYVIVDNSQTLRIELWALDPKGKQRWRATLPIEYGGRFVLDFPINPELLLTTGLHGEPGSEYYGLTDTRTGKTSELDYLPTAIRGKYMLVKLIETGVDFNPDYQGEREQELYGHAGYKVQSLDGWPVVDRFATPARKGCGPLRQNPLATEINPNPPSDPLARNSNTVKGEFIYAQRTDQCGKFTYRFKWTSPGSYGPEILKGWQ